MKLLCMYVHLFIEECTVKSQKGASLQRRSGPDAAGHDGRLRSETLTVLQAEELLRSFGTSNCPVSLHPTSQQFHSH